MSTVLPTDGVVGADALSPEVVIEFEGPNNTLERRVLRVGQRVRIEVEPTPAAAANGTTPLSAAGESALTAKATVRYVGPVLAAKDPRALMVGVEWDEAGRGKNDGAVGGRRYFTCTPGRGSFLHPARVRDGVSALTTAISDKYEARFQAETSLYLVAEHNQHNNTTAAAGGAADAVSPSAAVPLPERHIPVVFQGEEYMQGRIAAKLATLVDMTLTCGDIASAFDSRTDVASEARKLASKVPNCETMDLTDNLLRSWEEPALIAANLPKLRVLALSSNNLDISTLFERGDTMSRTLRSCFTDAFRNIEVLVLNTVPDALEAVLTLANAGALPSLTELHLCKNRLRTISAGITAAVPAAAGASADDRRSLLARAFPRLETLELSFNDLSDWTNEIRLLERLPSLRRLLVNSNQVVDVEYAESAPAAASASAPAPASDAAWASLNSLGINANQLASFTCVHALARFPVLRDLRLRDNAGLEERTMELNAGTNATDAPAAARNNADATSSPPAPASTISTTGAAAFTPTPHSAALLRLQLVARLPLVHTLNRSRVSERERIDAEKYYLLVAFQSTSRGAVDEASASSARGLAFPRYADLVRAHGDPAATVSALAKQLVEPTGSTLASKLVEVHLAIAETNGPAAAAAAAPATTSAGAAPVPATPLAAALMTIGLRVAQTQTKKLSSTLSVQAVRTLLDKAFKVPPHAKSRYVLVYRETVNAPDQTLDEPLKPINYYGVVNGGCIMLVPK